MGVGGGGSGWGGRVGGEVRVDVNVGGGGEGQYLNPKHSLCI